MVQVNTEDIRGGNATGRKKRSMMFQKRDKSKKDTGVEKGGGKRGHGKNKNDLPGVHGGGK